VDQSQRRFLRDLAFLLGVPAIVVVGLVAWGKPRTYRSHAVITFPHETNEARARAGGLREATWHGMQLSVPQEYVILSQDSVVEIVEQYPPQYRSGNWGSHCIPAPDGGRAAALGTAPRELFARAGSMLGGRGGPSSTEVPAGGGRARARVVVDPAVDM
jgi:hypothetical protein